MSLEQQVANLVEASNNLTGSVNGKLSEIDKAVTDAENQFNDFINSADAKFQTIIPTSNKYFGAHYVMSVSPPNYVDPANPDYKPGQVNGIVLWRIGSSNDSKRIRAIGFQGDLLLTRTGYEVYQKGVFRSLRQYDQYYAYVEDGISIALETMNIDGVDYRVLTSGMSGGGAVILDGFMAFDGRGAWGDSGSIRDDNFGRYVNTKDGAVYSNYAPIASQPYDQFKTES